MHVIVWQFIVRPDRTRDFVSAYKADGDWAQLFGLATGFRGTELLSSNDDAQRFVTLDRWDTSEDYARFQHHFGPQYRDLDAQLGGLTLSEIKLGTFATEAPSF